MVIEGVGEGVVEPSHKKLVVTVKYSGYNTRIITFILQMLI